MTYEDFLSTKQKQVLKSGFDINESELNPMLFPFQKFTIKRALKAGKYAIFADTGQGKTPMQLEIAWQCALKTGKCSLILSPLAVSGQTIEQGRKFNIDVKKYGKGDNIQILNYDQLNNIEELTDLATVCIMQCKHLGYDFIEEFEKVLKKNQERAKNGK